MGPVPNGPKAEWAQRAQGAMGQGPNGRRAQWVPGPIGPSARIKH
jgi:hypothetical protein